MVLQNFVVLQKDIPVRLHFVDHHVEGITITDPHHGNPSPRQRLVFDVDQVNGVNTQTRLSTLSGKLADKFAGYLADKSYTKYDFVITMTGDGFLTAYSVQAIPRS